MKKFRLAYYDMKNAASESFSFLRSLFNASKQGIIISVIFIGILIGFDFVARRITELLSFSTNNRLNSISDFIYRINDLIGIKFLDYFKDVIVIVAGVLGVIFGLFFTSFLNIITTKYSNINSTITYQLLNQKVINRYFKLLAILVSSAVFFQFLLVIGYSPTFISAIIFTSSVIIALLSFIHFGRYSLIYFNAGNLVFDLINDSSKILNRVYRNKKYFISTSDGEQVIAQILRNTKKIELIVEESTKPQLTNTALDSISKELVSFANYYNSFKHTLPSNKNWHPKIQKHKSWDTASSIEYEMFSRTGSTLLPESVDDYYRIEKEIISIQFKIFKQVESTDEIIQLINNQYKYLQTISFQCELELFDFFFDLLEQLIKKKLKAPEGKENLVNLKLISLYANLLIHYTVGFNHNLEIIVTETQLRKLAEAIHNRDSTDAIMQFPYPIRIWSDKYQVKLINEKFNEKKVLTPLFYTEYELAFQFQHLLKTFFFEASDNLYKRIITFSKYLKSLKLNLETLEFLIESLDVYNKVNFFSGTIENKIKKEINELNLQNEEQFSFEDREKLLERNEAFRNKVLKDIWQVGWSSYTVENKALPDIYGNFYQLICSDILDKSFENAKALIDLLPQFFTYNLLYIESLRIRIDSKRFEVTSSKLYPIIVDLFEISTITILLFKSQNNNALEKCFFAFWDTAFKEKNSEIQFWGMILPVYTYFSQPILGLSTPSYVREQQRKNRLEDYLKKSEFVRLDDIEGPHKSYRQRYVTDVDDFYLKEIVRSISIDGFGGLRSDDLSEVFIEYFLRTRIALKELDIKETRYGSNLSRNMGGNSI
ncbi:MAG: hypothetical protein WDZ47_01110 [Bacteroidales bacterium]